MSVDLSRRTHGRIATYAAGCRCAACTEAKRLYAHTNPKHRAYEKARTLAVKWLTANRPDVWRSLVQQALDDGRKP